MTTKNVWHVIVSADVRFDEPCSNEKTRSSETQLRSNLQECLSPEDGPPETVTS